MNIFTSFEDAKVIKNPVVTTGSFDGVHVGHKTILNRLKMLAEKHNGESVLITFDPHPRKVLYPDSAGKDLKLINSQEEKLNLLEKAGLNNVIIIEFTREFSRVTSEQFVRDYLHGILNAKVVVAGFNHHFGFNKEGDYKQLWSWQKKYSFKAEEIPEQEVQNETVSSTKIRKAISDGYIQRANAYLDHYYIIMGMQEKYESEKYTYLNGYIRILIAEDCKLLPSPGIYAVSVEQGDFYSKGMVVINKVAFSKNEVLVNIFNDNGIEKSRNVTVSFHKKIHGDFNLDENISIIKIKSAKEEISDLIY
ncbi:MAG TPA: adenylyltransferase/cytidyltransferase family protein [Bacteroidales bacterium]|nr:adenylyltransferase/cytidyltransferase family protein [Bacteroidales bacterium]